MSGIFIHYGVPIILLLYAMLYLFTAFILTNSVGTSNRITDSVKAAGVCFNALLAGIFISFYLLNLVEYNNSYGDEFLLGLIIFHVLNLLQCIFRNKNATSTTSFFTCVCSIIMCLTIVFGTLGFLL